MRTARTQENARSRIVAVLWTSVGVGTNEDEASTGRFWAAGFHHVTARSRLASILKLINLLSIFQIFRAVVISFHTTQGKNPIRPHVTSEHNIIPYNTTAKFLGVHIIENVKRNDHINPLKTNRICFI